MTIRAAESRDLHAIVELSRRVQETLTASGSLQQIGPLAPPAVRAQIDARTAHVLEVDGEVAGSVFVEPASRPVTAGLALLLAGYALNTSPVPLWYLHKLMIEPERQGAGLGWCS